jgi:hypothetical protein
VFYTSWVFGVSALTMTRALRAGQSRLVGDAVVGGVCPNTQVADWVSLFRASLSYLQLLLPGRQQYLRWQGNLRSLRLRLD